MPSIYEQINEMNRQLEFFVTSGLKDHPKRRDHYILNQTVKLVERLDSEGVSPELQAAMKAAAEEAYKFRECNIGAHLDLLARMMGQAPQTDKILLSN
ncbi:MAG: hypothetical protein WBK55_08095 [Alphaproteobacteria bacterium]